MARQLQFQWPKRRGPSDPWFRVGEIDVGTTGVVVALGVLSFFIYAIDKVLLAHLQFIPWDVSHGQLWRLVTWPMVNQPDIWTAFTLFILWIFGRDLESQFGRIRFTKFLALIVIVPAALTWGAYYLLGGATVSNFSSLAAIGVQGIRLLELGVFVAYVAERPTVKFFFGIPAWVMVAVIIGLDVLRYLGDRLWLALVFELLVAAVAVVLLRSFGYGDAVQWVPRINLPSVITGVPKARGARPSRPVKAKKPSKGAGDVVTGPWQGSGSSGGAGSPVNQKDVDRVLDKIAAHGMDSLTPDERHLLEEASRRKRDGRA